MSKGNTGTVRPLLTDADWLALKGSFLSCAAIDAYKYGLCGLDTGNMSRDDMTLMTADVSTLHAIDPNLQPAALC